MHLAADPWVWVAAILTLFIFTFLYKDNPLYKFAEHLLVGVSAGYYLAIYWHNGVKPNIIDHLGQGQLIYLIPLILGLMFFTIFIPKTSYMIRWPIAFLLGAGSGLSIPATFQANIAEQIKGTMLQPLSFYYSNAALINAIILFVGVLTVLTYFFFSKEHKGALYTTARIGIIFLMIGFGASFGYTVMARVSLLIGRLQFLLGNWLGIIPSW
ncbi:MAG: hypothetical protein J7K11_05530 [Candidatus Hydrothermae bacterium]|nr:hypothetical protein [Candidatus Hydrothermae bacterium]